MLIDITQRGNALFVSYAGKSGNIEMHEFDIQATNGFGVYDYEICDESDPDKEPVLRHFKDNLPIKKKTSWKFDFDELREFLLKQVPPEIHQEIFDFTLPDMYMVDIETEMSEGQGFPIPSLAEQRIDSIQITSPTLRTIILTINDRVVQTPEEMAHVEDLINDHYKDVSDVWELTDRLKYAHIKFDSEKEMVEYFWKLVREKLHSISFWNGERFDVPYLNTRSGILGIDMGMGSPTGEVSHYHNWPKHRYVFDYMQIVAKWAWDLTPLVSVALDYVTKRIFGVGKVQYDGDYLDLYQGPIDNFLLYGAVDTINMQLIHLKKNYTAAKESLVYYTKTSMYDANKVTAQVHALCWDELYAANMINALPFERKQKKPYKGGYVKQPTRKFVMFPVGVDFSALYPRIMQSFNMSFENFEGHVKDEAHKKELVEKGYYVSVNGNYYRNDKDYTLRKIEDKMLAERYAYKDLMMNIYQDAMTPIEKELLRRGSKAKAYKS